MKFALCILALTFAAFAQPRPISVKVVVVTMFERGEDTGDAPGEFQYWVEREHLDKVIPIPAGYHNLRMNSAGVLGMVTGVGTAKAAASIMALGLDPRFDLSKAHWLIAGIGGGDRPMFRSAQQFGPNMSSTAILLMRSMPAKFPRTGQPALCHCAKRSHTNFP